VGGLPTEKETGLKAVTAYLSALIVLVFLLSTNDWNHPPLWMLTLLSLPVVAYLLLASLPQIP